MNVDIASPRIRYPIIERLDLETHFVHIWRIFPEFDCNLFDVSRFYSTLAFLEKDEENYLIY